MKKSVLAMAMAMSTTALPIMALSITDMKFAQRDGQTQVDLELDGEVPTPSGYSIENPPRIAVDIPGATNGMSSKRFDVNADGIRKAFLMEANGRSRLVLQLSKLLPYKWEAQGNTLRILLGDPNPDYLQSGSEADRPGNAALSNISSEVVASDMRVLSDMDFRAGKDGSASLMLNFDREGGDVRVLERGPEIVVKLPETVIKNQIRHHYNAEDFATLVNSFSLEQNNDAGEIRIQVDGDYRYLAHQSGRNYTLEISPEKPELPGKDGESGYQGKKISLNFQDIEVRSVLQLIADFTGMNLVASDAIRGNITLRLNQVPWDQALALILKTKGLDKRLDGNVLMVAPARELAEQERQALAAREQYDDLAPLYTEMIRIRYADVADVQSLFSREKDEERLLSTRGKMVMDERTNALLVTETRERLDKIRDLIDLIDVPIRQVQVEARIVRASAGIDRSLGVRWGGKKIGDHYRVGAALEDAENDDLDIIGSAVDLGVTGPAGSVALGYLQDDFALRLELSALESKGGGEVISQPKVITGDKQTAIIKEGTEIPYQESSANGESTVAFKEAVLKLEVTPYITHDDRILMDLVINQDSVGKLIIATGGGGTAPTIDTTEITTKVLANDGQTIVLGGVYTSAEVKTTTKVPLLGDIPYLGQLFKSTSVKEDKLETLIFITPRILTDIHL